MAPSNWCSFATPTDNLWARGLVLIDLAKAVPLQCALKSEPNFGPASASGLIFSAINFLLISRLFIRLRSP